MNIYLGLNFLRHFIIPIISTKLNSSFPKIHKKIIIKLTRAFFCNLGEPTQEFQWFSNDLHLYEDNHTKHDKLQQQWQKRPDNSQPSTNFAMSYVNQSSKNPTTTANQTWPVYSYKYDTNKTCCRHSNVLVRNQNNGTVNKIIHRDSIVLVLGPYNLPT